MKYLTLSYTTKDPVTAGRREGWKCLEAGSEQPKMKHMAMMNREITMATHVPKNGIWLAKCDTSCYLHVSKK